MNKIFFTSSCKPLLVRRCGELIAEALTQRGDWMVENYKYYSET